MINSYHIISIMMVPRPRLRLRACVHQMYIP